MMDRIKESCKILISQLPALRKCMKTLQTEGHAIETVNFEDPMKNAEVNLICNRVKYVYNQMISINTC